MLLILYQKPFFLVDFAFLHLEIELRLSFLIDKSLDLFLLKLRLRLGWLYLMTHMLECHC